MYACQNHRKSWTNRTTLLYVNYDIARNEGQRQAALSRPAARKLHSRERKRGAEDV